MGRPAALLAGASSQLTWIAVGAALLAVLLPSTALAQRSDLLLAALVLVTALGISVEDLATLRRHRTAVAFLSVAPLITLGLFAWLLGRPFGPDVRDGLLGVGLSSSEVAAVGLVSLAGADAALAVGAVTGSLIAAAILGPLAIGLLGGHADGGKLLVRFALVVVLPLVLGVAVRSARPAQRWLAARDQQRDGMCALIVAVLVYAALSGARGGHNLAAATLAAALFLAGSVVLAWAWLALSSPALGGAARGPRSPGDAALPGAFAIGMRDFAVAAALATQAFGTGAGTVPGIYGVLMLIAGSLAVSRIRRTAGPRLGDTRPADAPPPARSPPRVR